MGVRSLLFAFLCFSSVGILCAQPHEFKPSFIYLDSAFFAQKSSIVLDTTWEMYWHEFVTPKEFAGQVGLNIDLPSYWNGHLVNGEKLPGSGYATFRIQVISNEENHNSALFISKISTSYLCYWNGELVAQCGRTGSSAQEGKPGLGIEVTPILIQKGVNELVFHVSNYDYRSGGFFKAPQIGYHEEIYTQYSMLLAYDLILFGVIFIIFIYHIAFFALRRKSISDLLFALFALNVAIRIVVTSDQLLDMFFPLVSWSLAYKIEYLTFFFALPLHILLYRVLFPYEFSKIFTTVNCVLFFGLAAFCLVTPPKIYTHLLTPTQVTQAIGGVMVLGFLTKAALRKRKGAKEFILGSFILFMAFLNDSLYYQAVLKTYELFPFGMFIFIFIQSYVLSKRFTTAFKENEDLTKTLDAQNKNLEELVKLRTVEVEMQKEEIEAQRDSILTSYENSKMLSAIGYQITSTLDVNFILHTIYENVEKLMPTDIFSIGIYDGRSQQIHYPIVVIDGEKTQIDSQPIGAKNSFANWCIEYKKEIMIHDLASEYTSYFPHAQLDDLSLPADKPSSLIYLPLLIQNKILGIITVQSYKKRTYSEWNKSMLGTLGVYIASALENAANHEKSEKLLLNILPQEVADELKKSDAVEAKYYQQATVLFTDFKGFTQLTGQMSPHEVVDLLNLSFRAFDEICERNNVEKIKTIGDAYMCVGGIPVPNTTNASDCVRAGIEMQAFMDVWKRERVAAGLPVWELRLGIHTGELIAGVIGTKKFAYDVWGDTVNTASRMESAGEGGKINISGATYALVKDEFNCQYRGKIEAKGKGEVDMYFVTA